MTAPAGESQFRAMRDAARTIFLEALSQASIAKGFERHVQYERGILRVREDLYDLHSFSKVLVISLGKAGHTMAQALAAQLGSIAQGIVATPVFPDAQVRTVRNLREN